MPRQGHPGSPHAPPCMCTSSSLLGPSLFPWECLSCVLCCAKCCWQPSQPSARHRVWFQPACTWSSLVRSGSVHSSGPFPRGMFGVEFPSRLSCSFSACCDLMPFIFLGLYIELRCSSCKPASRVHCLSDKNSFGLALAVSFASGQQNIGWLCWFHLQGTSKCTFAFCQRS